MLTPLIRYRRRISSFSRNARLYLLNTALGSLSWSISNLFFNLYILSLGLDKTFLGLLTSIPSFVALVISLPAGVLADRIGHKRALVIGGTVMAITSLGVALTGVPAALVGLNLLGGAASSLFHVSSIPFLAENSGEDERTSLFSVNFSLITLMGFAGSLVGGVLPGLLARLARVPAESAPAYRMTLLVVAGLRGTSLFPLLLMGGGRRAGVSYQRIRLTKALGKLRLWGKLVLPEIIISTGAALLIPYMNVFFKERFAIPDATLGLVFAVSGLCTGLATLVGPLLADRWGKVRSVVLTQGISVPFMLTLGFVPLLPVAVLSFWVRAALMNMGGPLYSAFVMEQLEEGERATVSSLRSMGWNVGWAVSSYLSGLIQTHYGFSPIFLTTATLYVLGISVTYVFFASNEDKAPWEHS